MSMVFLSMEKEDGSLCYLGGKEQSSCCDEVSVELGETVEHVESLHVDYCCVDA